MRQKKQDKMHTESSNSKERGWRISHIVGPSFINPKRERERESTH